MLEQICDFIHNYFEYERHEGTFDIIGCAIELPFLADGQRFRIQGSALNDGIYTYRTGGMIYDADGENDVQLQAEHFTGAVTAMAVPKAVLDLAREINDWQVKNADALNSPYTSESFGGYSYTKATSSNASGVSGTLSWRDVFGKRLNAYRKIA